MIGHPKWLKLLAKVVPCLSCPSSISGRCTVNTQCHCTSSNPLAHCIAL